jgi:hypothetical protein
VSEGRWGGRGGRGESSTEALGGCAGSHASLAVFLNLYKQLRRTKRENDGRNSSSPNSSFSRFHHPLSLVVHCLYKRWYDQFIALFALDSTLKMKLSLFFTT